MNESHESCDKLYDCSSTLLNELTSLARASGALGSRLTGAGWGGCCVSLVRKTDLKTFIDKVMHFYTKERPQGDELWITDDLNHYIFGTQLGSGALVLDPTVSVWHA
jgi:galactokinase